MPTGKIRLKHPEMLTRDAIDRMVDLLEAGHDLEVDNFEVIDALSKALKDKGLKVKWWRYDPRLDKEVVWTNEEILDSIKFQIDPRP